MEQTIPYPYKSDSKRYQFLKRLFAALLFIGLGLSSYLFYRHAVGSAGKVDVCSALFGKGCDGALNSSVGTQLGLPLAGWGIIYYCLQIALWAWPSFLGKPLKVNTAVPVLLLCSLAGIGSISLLAIMLFEHSLFCPVCVLIHFTNLLLFVCATQITGYSLPVFFTTARQELKSLFNYRSEKRAAIKSWFGIGTFLLLAFCLYTALQIISDKAAALDPQKIITQFEETPRQSVPVDNSDPVFGSSNSSIQIIVFSDFECSSCRGFSRVLYQLKKKYKGQFSVVFKHFPLGSCNPVVTKNIHPKACEAALAAEAARQQGKFWQYHDVLFFYDLSKTNVPYATLAAKLHLDSAKFEEARNGEAAKREVGRAIAEGLRLKIDGTPAVYLNGRPVNDFRLQPMEVLFDHILAQQSAPH
ncbi:vitamin K epoxide reductase family protein [Flavisolibacter ginsenosidimutans]|uniref:Vitamin K epoxide reductase domain-containing protein n=1 Tax=Flavisolibacter ginsenosidimutans TaxID=661481 RepID=A0A5B8UM96_9BACT|nr:thioredoxin domain-containing protein [Flavisolibacter ginsenosidimutans]QEC57688.1 hypothetical protein FSB75_17855 [Flavisolibacter ginsenosidimutans]